MGKIHFCNIFIRKFKYRTQMQEAATNSLQIYINNFINYFLITIKRRG